ncbi:structure-specific endonuclease subunit SLX1 [Choristoneura fumiferana]|uniref:structure-specific endonuclease subunit SLX1 n=1 Tax=Choristoneura fumiferana TaxID=7141 RepID=UPI003D15B3FD
MAEPELIEDFFGVYLLYNINPKYKGRTYIGYTRDPNRRLMQHNRGTWAGGAHRTSNKGPWKMVMIVHGFPNNISALRFEWAWQNPAKTTRLQHLNLKRVPRKETEFRFQLRVLSQMLRVGPWCRLPLLIRWLEKDFFEEFPPEREPPSHMKICHGPVKSRNLKKVKKNTDLPHTECLICSGYITSAESKLTCLNSDCELISHITCLAKLFLEPSEFVPLEGLCPFCGTNLKWGDLIRKIKGCSEVPRGDAMSQDDDEGDDEDVLSQDRGFVDNNSVWLQEFDDL